MLDPKHRRAFIACDDHNAGVRALEHLTEEKRDADRPIKGLNFFKRTEQQLLRALQRPEFNIHGVRRADLIALLPQLSPAALPRQSRRLRRLGAIKRVAGTYRYYLTRLGHAAIAPRLLDRRAADRSGPGGRDVVNSLPFWSKVKW